MTDDGGMAVVSQVVIFDLELGGPVSRIARPPRLAAFSRILDVQAERSLPRSSQGDGRGSGVDFLLCLHTVRMPRAGCREKCCRPAPGMHLAIACMRTCMQSVGRLQVYAARASQGHCIGNNVPSYVIL